MTYIYVDVEAAFNSPCPELGSGMTEFGAVEYETSKSFHGMRGPTEESWKAVFAAFDEWLGQFSPPYVFVSDNPAYDWQWINYHFWHELGKNPFGHSARRIGDYYAGLVGNWRETQKWKKLRKTVHDHNPVHDALGNVEAVRALERGERP